MRKLFQVMGFVENREATLRFRGLYPALVKGHRRLGSPKLILLGTPKLEGLVLIDKLIIL